MSVQFLYFETASFMFSCRELYVLSSGNVGFPDVNRMAYGRET